MSDCLRHYVSREQMSKYTIIVEGKFSPDYESIFPEYSKKVRSYLEKHNGEVVRRQKIEKALYGDSAPDLYMVIDFPNKEVAETIFFEQEYLDIIPLRNKVFSDFKMYIAPYGEI